MEVELFIELCSVEQVLPLLTAAVQGDAVCPSALLLVVLVVPTALCCGVLSCVVRCAHTHTHTHTHKHTPFFPESTLQIALIFSSVKILLFDLPFFLFLFLK